MPPTTPPTDDRTEPDFADWLAALDESLASGRDTHIAGEITPANDRVRKAASFLEKLEAVWPRAQTPSIDPPTLEELARLRDEELRGKTFGRFVIEREMGRGGHGVVFLAFDPALKRNVALKVPRPDVLVTDALRRRFIREAQAAAVLDHPNITPIYETGEFGPACYLAAGYCNGPNLGEWMQSRRSPIAPRQAALIALKMAEALQHAHERQIFHRDVKPSNILLEPRVETPGDEGLPFTPKLTDFGLAKVVEEQCGEDTRTGSILGTPRYMAPEQAEGRLKDVGPATDVHGVGVTLYEMLAGQPPFLGVGDGETLHLVRTAEPTPPSKHRDGIPRDLEAICLKCLEKEIGERYSSAHAMVEDLRRFFADKPTIARPIRWPDRVVRWGRREPMGAAFAIGCVLAAASIASTWVWYTLKIHAAADLAASLSREINERDRAVRMELAAAELQIAVDDWRSGEFDGARARIARLLAERNATAALGSSLKFVGELAKSPGMDAWKRSPLVTDGRRWLSATLSPDGACAIAVTTDGRLQRADLSGGRVEWSVALPRRMIGPVQWRWSSDGCRVACWDDGGSMIVVDRSGELAFNGIERGRLAIPCNRRGRFLYFTVAAAEGLVAVDAGGIRRSLPSGREEFADAHLFDGERKILLLRRRGGIKVVDVVREEVTMALPAPAAGDWRRLAYCEANRTAAAFNSDGRPAFWELQTGKRWMGEPGEIGEAASLQFLPDGKTLIAVGREGRLAAWHAPTGRRLAEMKNSGGVFDLRSEIRGVWILMKAEDGRPQGVRVRSLAW